MLKIKTIIENNIDNENLLINEHGLSLLIEYDNKKILFDTGQSGDFINNAKKLKIDLREVDIVVLSHGHYDHSGGFTKLVKEVGNNFKLIIGNSFFNKKYKEIEDNIYKYNGNPFDEKFISDNNIDTKYITEDVYYINENIMIFSRFTKINKYEEFNDKLKIKQGDDFKVDIFSDEIALGINTDNGLVLIVGCSHVGIINIIKNIKNREYCNIYGIIGGTHLVDKEIGVINKTIDYFNNSNIKVLGLSHCTGEKAMNVIKNNFKGEFILNNTGNIVEFK